MPLLHGRQRHWDIEGSQVEHRRRENRGAVGCALSQKIYEFFISKWCDMVHSGCVVFKNTGRIADKNDSVLRYSEVPLKGKNKTLVKYWEGRQNRTTPAGQILGVATPATPAALTPMRCCGFSAVRRAGRRYRSIAAPPALSTCGAAARRSAANASSVTCTGDVGS